MSSHSASQLFDVFVEAKSALEELPKVKADLEAAQQLATETETKLSNRIEYIDEITRMLGETRVALAAREAELARVTFQHETLRSAIGAINDTVRSVSDRPVSEPVAEPVSQPVSEASQGQSAAGESSNASSPVTEDHVMTAETPADASQGNLDRPLAPENASTTAKPQMAEDTTTPGGPAGTHSPTDSPTKEDREPMGEAAATTMPKPIPQTESDMSTHGTSSNHSAKPYLGWGSHRKPHNVTWGEFERLGGYRPHWCNPDLT
jgi:hypothetical protein